MNNAFFLRASLIPALLLLAACSEPNPPAQADDAAAAPAASNPATDAAFGSVPLVELTYDQRREPLLPAKDCNLERADGAVFTGEPARIAAGSALQLSGWVADRAAGTVPKEAYVRLVGADSRVWRVAVQPQLKRADVQALLGGDDAFASAGYSATLDTARLPAGNYRMYTVYQGTGGLMACDNGRALVIGG